MYGAEPSIRGTKITPLVSSGQFWETSVRGEYTFVGARDASPYLIELWGDRGGSAPDLVTTFNGNEIRAVGGKGGLSNYIRGVVVIERDQHLYFSEGDYIDNSSETGFKRTGNVRVYHGRSGIGGCSC